MLLYPIEGCPAHSTGIASSAPTAASGQMTRMVFAVTGRGKTSGRTAEKVEVGSWVIGYWRPSLHFEVNVWNCFENRARKMLKALKNVDGNCLAQFSPNVADVLDDNASYHIAPGDCRKEMANIPSNSASLIITDPPHNDRVPYLELSEFWNSLTEGSDRSLKMKL